MKFFELSIGLLIIFYSSVFLSAVVRKGYWLVCGHPLLIQKTASWSIWEEVGMCFCIRFSLDTLNALTCSLRLEERLLLTSQIEFSVKVSVGLPLFNAQTEFRLVGLLLNSCVLRFVFSATVTSGSFTRIKWAISVIGHLFFVLYQFRFWIMWRASSLRNASEVSILLRNAFTGQLSGFWKIFQIRR